MEHARGTVSCVHAPYRTYIPRGKTCKAQLWLPSCDVFHDDQQLAVAHPGDILQNPDMQSVSSSSDWQKCTMRIIFPCCRAAADGAAATRKRGRQTRGTRLYSAMEVPAADKVRPSFVLWVSRGVRIAKVLCRVPCARRQETHLSCGTMEHVRRCKRCTSLIGCCGFGAKFRSKIL